MKQVKYFVMDVDGTLTDGKIYMSPSGEAMKAFNIKDGCGIHDILLPYHIIPVILTGRKIHYCGKSMQRNRNYGNTSGTFK